MSTFKPLLPAPAHIETFKEIAVLYNQDLPALYNALTPQERIFIYYIFRASLPGNTIAADQIHRDALAIKEIFEAIVDQAPALKKLHDEGNTLVKPIKLGRFLQEARTYLVYLWSNHSHYFARESANEKRTPARLGLSTLTKENLINICTALEKPELVKKIEAVEKSLFDHTFEPTVTIPNSIEQSALNAYSPDFTEQDYLMLSPDERDMINAYFYVEYDGDKRIPKVMPYSKNGKYSSELTIATHWLQKAHEHTQKFPKQFDAHLIKSLEYLIQFLETGDEEFFKQHSIEWLKSSSRIDYNFGFIETYQDPKAKRGAFQAEATIKSFDLVKLNRVLPKIEQMLPFPAGLKRQITTNSPTAMPNASMNTKIFGTGALGPMLITAAYCLPNYEEIRSTHGSKQIIYPGVKGLDALINPSLSHKLFYLPTDADQLEEIDPEYNFFNDLWDLHCILHETLGHGSGQLANHTFKQGDPLSICGKQYAVGDTIAVTHENLPELLLGHDATIEELRAEIIALYVSIKHLDDIIKAGFLTHWSQRIGKAELARWLLLHMANTGLLRIIQQNDDATEMAGDHARANCTIMNYLIAKNGLSLRQEQIEIDGTQQTILALEMLDMETSLDAVTKLMQDVQRIKSTGDGRAAQKLIDTYGKPLNREHLKLLKHNEKLITGDLKARVYIYPLFTPVTDENGTIIDINAEWPKNIFDQHKKYAALEVSIT